MRKIYIIALFICLIHMLASCDEGRIYPDETVQTEEGGTARFSGTVAGLDTWSRGYTLALAGFEEGNDYALISKNIEPAVEGGRCDVALSGIPAEVTKIELCAIDRLRRRVATFLAADYNPNAATLQIDAERVDMSMAAAIQNEIFNTTCVQCHGATGHAAARLNLLEGQSFANLISVPSRKIPGKDRVAPGSSNESVLFLILDTGISAAWSYDHSVEVVRQETRALIRKWIAEQRAISYDA